MRYIKLERLSLYLISLFIVFPMTLSQLVLPILAERQNALFTFGVFYSAMALAGVFSFLYIRFIDRLGIRISVFVGFMFYGVSMLLRAYIESLYCAVIAGGMGGMGACFIMLSTRCLIAELAEPVRAEVLKNMNVYKSAGSILVAITVLIFGYLFIDSVGRIEQLLYVSASSCFISAVFFLIVLNLADVRIDVNNDLRGLLLLKGNVNTLMIGFLTFNLLCGLYVSLSAPFVYIKLLELSDGESIYNLSLYLVFVSLIAIFAYGLGNQLKRRFSVQGLFVVTGLLFCLCNLTLYASFDSELILITICILRALFIVLTGYYQELLQYSVIDNTAKKGLILSIAMSAFLLGDMLGGMLAGVIGSTYGVSSIFLLSSVIIFFHVIGFAYFSQQQIRR